MENPIPQQGSNIDNPEKQESEVFVIGRGFTLVGNVRGHGLCVVDGFVDGSIETADIKINESGSVSGELKCSRLDVNGRITGQVAAQHVVLRYKGLIEGSVSYDTISMQTGAIIDGTMTCTKLRKATVSEDNDMVVSGFSPEVQDLIKDAKDVTLSWADGTPAPTWVKLQNDGIAIRRSKLKELQGKNEAPSFMLNFDGKKVFIKFE